MVFVALVYVMVTNPSSIDEVLESISEGLEVVHASPSKDVKDIQA